MHMPKRWRENHLGHSKQRTLRQMPQKQLVSVGVAVVLCLAVAGVFVLVSRMRDGFSPAPPLSRYESYGEQATRVAFDEATAASGGLTVKLLPEPAADGSLVYQVSEGPGTSGSGAVLGTFNYIPWLDRHPLYQAVAGSDVVLGNSVIFTDGDRQLHPLTEGTGIGSVLDFAVKGDLLALAGKSNNASDDQIYIWVKNLDGGGSKQIDSFSCPQNLSAKDVYLCWAGGSLYYDYCLEGNPAVKVYDPTSGQAAVFKEGAMDPQASPDGRYLAIFSPGVPDGKDPAGLGLEVIDLQSGNLAAVLEGTNRLFWCPGLVINWDSDHLQLHIYDLNSGAKLKDLPMDCPVSDLAVSGGVLSGFKYQFVNRQITREQFQANLDDISSKSPG